MIDPLSDDLITLAQAARLPLFRRNGKAAHVATLHRYVSPGRLGVRLEVLETPMGMRTTAQACADFVKRFHDAKSGKPAGGAEMRRHEPEAELDGIFGTIGGAHGK